jgi:hypothetical protein
MKSMTVMMAVKTNRSRRIAQALLVLGVAFACSLPVRAQILNENPLLAQKRGPQLTVAPIDTITVARGGKAQLTLQLELNRGFHVNSHRPSEDYLLPTTVSLSPQEGIMIVKIAYPQGEVMKFHFAGSDHLSVYSGRFQVTAEVRARRDAALGRQRVHGEVRYQACDDHQCFPPKSTPLHFDVLVVRPKSTHR